MTSVFGKDVALPLEGGAESPAPSEDYRMLRLALHEIRTPLTSVQLSAQLLERSLTKLGLEKECRLAAMIVSSARKLNALTEELGDVARLRSGKADLDIHTHDLSRWLPEFLSRHAGDMDTTRIRLAAPAGPLAISVDAARLDRILANLLSVSLNQDTGRSGIDLLVSVAEDKVRFTLTAPCETEVPGEDAIGLGLLVARLLVELHGGRLEVTQDATCALVLCFWLPRAPAQG